jgi:nicotinate-nucleotide--dimethylbenzimidazole phosphoribosyltransferase
MTADLGELEAEPEAAAVPDLEMYLPVEAEAPAEEASVVEEPAPAEPVAAEPVVAEPVVAEPVAEAPDFEELLAAEVPATPMKPEPSTSVAAPDESLKS